MKVLSVVLYYTLWFKGVVLTLSSLRRWNDEHETRLRVKALKMKKALSFVVDDVKY